MMKEIIKRYLLELNPWVILILLLIFAAVVGLVLSWIAFKGLRLNGKRYDKKSLYNVAIRDLERPVEYFIAVLLMTNAVKIVPLMEPENSFFPFTEASASAMGILLRIVLYIVSAWVLTRIINIFIELIKDKNDVDNKNNLHQRKILTQLQFIKKISLVVIILVAVSMALLEFEEVRKIGTALITSAGVAGIIIGFAAQKSIANLLAGFQIAFTQPIRIDDVVIVEGEFGRVEEITLTYVVVTIWDQRRIIMPLNYFIEKPFQNWTRLSAELLGTVFIFADYQLPIKALRQELERITDHHPLWDKRARNVMLTDLTENVMKIRILVSAQSAGEAFDLRCDIREQMITFIQKNYPHCLPKTRVEMSVPIKEIGASIP